MHWQGASVRKIFLTSWRSHQKVVFSIGPWPHVRNVIIPHVLYQAKNSSWAISASSWPVTFFLAYATRVLGDHLAFTFVDFGAFVEDVVHNKRLVHMGIAETYTEVNFVCTGMPGI